MLYPRYVQVSLDAPEQWWDPCSERWFKQSEGLIDLPKGLDATNIILYLRRNYLIDMTSTMIKVEETHEDGMKPPLSITPNQLLDASPALKPDVPPIEETIKILEDVLMPKIPKITKDKGDWKEVCNFCGKECSPKGIQTHRKYCPSNPDNIKE